jgi:hypothetical protein
VSDAEVLERAVRGEFVGGIERCGPVLVSALREMTMEYQYLRERAAAMEATVRALASGGDLCAVADECYRGMMDGYPKWRERFLADHSAAVN